MHVRIHCATALSSHIVRGDKLASTCGSHNTLTIIFKKQPLDLEQFLFDLALTLIQLNLVLVCLWRLIFQNSAGSFKYSLNLNCSLAILFLCPSSGLHLASVFCSWRLRSHWQTHTCPQRLFLICFFTIVRILLSSAVVFVGLIVPLWLQSWCL